MTANGDLPSYMLTDVGGGIFLRDDAAAAYLRLIRAYPTLTGLTDDSHGYRTYAEQERIFRLNYQTTYVQYEPGKTDKRVWNGRAWYRKKGAVSAAVPGTSNHGWGIAGDFQGLGGFDGSDYRVMAANAPAYGWNNDEGRTINEAWHWGYDPADDKHKEDGAELSDKIKLSAWMDAQMPGSSTEMSVADAVGYMAAGSYTSANAAKALSEKLDALIEVQEKSLTAQLAMLGKMDELISAVKNITVTIPPIELGMPAFNITGVVAPVPEV